MGQIFDITNIEIMAKYSKTVISTSSKFPFTIRNYYKSRVTLITMLHYGAEAARSSCILD